MTVTYQTVKKNEELNAKLINEDLKAKLVSSTSYINNMAEFERKDNFKIKVICGGTFFLIVGFVLGYYEYIPIPVDWYPITAAAAIFLVGSFIIYASLTGDDFNKFATDFFNENQKIIEDSFYNGLNTVDRLYTDSSLDKPIRVKVCNADIISFSKEIIFNVDSCFMVIYCVSKVEGVAIRVKKIVRLSQRGDGLSFGEVLVSDYEVSRLSSDDLVCEYKNSPEIYQEHFA